MDNFLKIIKNKWVRLGVSVLSLGYVYFTGFIAWLVFAYELKPTNNASLFALYLFINFMFGAEMYYTRKSIITKVCAAVIPLEVFAAWIAGFGNWYVLIPPLVVCMIVFFSSGLNETFKMVLGTIYMLLFVVGSLAYVTLMSFNITLHYVLTGDDLDMTTRQGQALYSPEKSYRLVTYVDKGTDRTTTSYYLEESSKDMSFWFLDCERTYGGKRLLTTVYRLSVDAEWMSDNQLLIDGKVHNVEWIFYPPPSHLIKDGVEFYQDAAADYKESLE